MILDRDITSVSTFGTWNDRGHIGDINSIGSLGLILGRASSVSTIVDIIPVSSFGYWRNDYSTGDLNEIGLYGWYVVEDGGSPYDRLFFMSSILRNKLFESEIEDSLLLRSKIQESWEANSHL